jgi:hypothetical protein
VCQLQNTEHNIGINVAMQALNSENSVPQQHMYSSAAEQLSSRNIASRHTAMNHAPSAPHELASFSLSFLRKSKLGIASENTTASGINVTEYPVLSSGDTVIPRFTSLIRSSKTAHKAKTRKTKINFPLLSNGNRSVCERKEFVFV